MKRIIFAMLAVGLLFTANSCKKCGHCAYAAGGNSGATCKNNGLFPGITGDSYQQAEADCVANGDTWVVH